MTQKLKFVLGRVENIVGKEENAGYERFLLSEGLLKLTLSGFPKSLKKKSLTVAQ